MNKHGLDSAHLSGLRFLILCWLCSTLLPEPRRKARTAAGAASWESNPPEDLSGPPPLFETVAGRKYHCRLTGSLRTACQNRRPGMGARSPPFGRRFMEESPQVGLGASPVSLSCFAGPSANVFSLSDMTAQGGIFQRAMRRILFVPSSGSR